MDNYLYQQAYFSGDLPGFGVVSRFLGNWRAKRAVNRLVRLDDRMLDDIGLNRPLVEWSSRLPLSVNAINALYDRAAVERFTGRLK